MTSRLYARRWLGMYLCCFVFGAYDACVLCWSVGPSAGVGVGAGRSGASGPRAAVVRGLPRLARLAGVASFPAALPRLGLGRDRDRGATVPEAQSSSGRRDDAVEEEDSRRPERPQAGRTSHDA